MAKRRDEFVVRYGVQGLIQGQRDEQDDRCWPLSAAKALEDYMVTKWAGRRRRFYRLVPVTVAEVERQAARERARGKRKGGGR